LPGFNELLRMKKNTLLLAGLFLLLGAAAVYVWRNQLQDKKSLPPDRDFAVKDAADIQRVFLADRKGQTALIERSEKGWLYNGKHPARQDAVASLLETLTRLTIHYVPPKAAEKAMVESIAANGIKVEVYNKDKKKIKCFYVGGVTNDETGTYAIMENAEQPYVITMRGFIGSVRSRLIFTDEQWRDRTIFAEKPETIQSITLEYPQARSESFRLEKKGAAEYDVTPYFSTTTASKNTRRKGAAEAYVLNFESLVAEGFENANPLRDSVRSLTPFAILTVFNIHGEAKVARFWPAGDEGIGQPIERYFTDINGQDFMLTQQHVFGKVFRGYNHFFAPETPR